MNVRIRLMSLDDYDNVFNLWIKTPGMGLNNVDDSRDGIERYLKRNPDTCFVAEEEGGIFGAILAGHDGRRGFIHHTIVLPEHRNRGIGRRLTESVMSALEAQGINKVVLFVFSENKAGNLFWEKMGFSTREDLIYRNKNIHELKRIDTTCCNE